jgi:hypothetical protein
MASTKSKKASAAPVKKPTTKKLASVGKVIKKAVAAITTKGRAVVEKTPVKTPAKKTTATKVVSKPVAKKAPEAKTAVAKPLSGKDAMKATIAAESTLRRDTEVTTKRVAPVKETATAEKQIRKPVKKSTKPSAVDKIAQWDEVDMSIFAPPRPLEAKSDQAISDDEMATLREMEATQEAIDRVRQRAIITPPEDFDDENCVACGLEIEKRRLKLGYYTCIDCERKKELTAKLFRR